jgi:YHS domain-containing protein
MAGKAWIGLVVGAALVVPAATLAAASTTRPAGAAASQPASRPASQPTTQPAAAKTDAEVIKAQLADYPLDTCVVSGEKLGEMGKPVDYVYKGRLVRFCCSHCKADFNKDPAKYLTMIDKAAATRPAGKTGDKVTK